MDVASLGMNILPELLCFGGDKQARFYVPAEVILSPFLPESSYFYAQLCFTFCRKMLGALCRKVDEQLFSLSFEFF